MTVFQNIADDKVAGRWLLATPGSQLSLSSSAFQEAMSAHLCLPSPAVVTLLEYREIWRTFYHLSVCVVTTGYLYRSGGKLDWLIVV